MGNYAAWCKTSSEQGHPLSALPSTKQSNNSTFNESCHIFVRDVFTTFQAFAFRFLKFLIQTKSQEMCEDTVSVNNHADTFMVYNSNHSLKRIMVFCLQVRAFFFFPLLLHKFNTRNFTNFFLINSEYMHDFPGSNLNGFLHKKPFNFNLISEAGCYFLGGYGAINF